VIATLAESAVILSTAPDIAAWDINCDVKIFTGSSGELCELAKPATEKTKLVKQVFKTLFFIVYFHAM
jgi:hypothetical protein